MSHRTLSHEREAELRAALRRAVEIFGQTELTAAQIITTCGTEPALLCRAGLLRGRKGCGRWDYVYELTF